MKQLLLLGGLCTVAFLSCSKEDGIVRNQSVTESVGTLPLINSFKSATDLNSAIGSTLDQLRSSRLYNLNEGNENLENLVPNDNFRRLLNEKGQFIVADTLYQITPQGTWFAHVSDSAELSSKTLSQSIAPMEQLQDSLYKVGNVYLFKTFGDHLADADVQDSYLEEENSEDLRQFTLDTEPDIDSFPVKNMNRVTVVGKFLEGLLGTKKDGTVVLKSNHRRRLSGSLYSYNYIVYAERGLMAQMEKKMWHGGWGKLINWGTGTTIGYHGIIFREDIPNLSSDINPLYSKSIGDVAVFGKDDGVALEILQENFLLDPAHKFAFYPMRSTTPIDQNKIEEIARILKEGNRDLSFKKLSQVHDTKCVGFVIDSPSENARYTYILGTSRWSSGPRQVKIIDKQGAQIKWGKMLLGAGQVVLGSIKYTVPAGSVLEIITTVAKPGSVINGLKTMADSFTAAKSRYHVAGSAFAYTQDGEEYCGMIMYKQGFGK